jgi:DNA-binding NarL/FixJ family response regulator
LTDAGDPSRRRRTVALRIADPLLAGRIAAHLDALPSVESADEDEAEIVVADGAFARGGATEAALIALVDRSEAVRALRSGAEAVLPPDASREELWLAIKAAARGFAVVPADILGDLLDREELPEEVDRTRPILTAREGEVLALLAAGASNKAIARRLGISAHTAKFHVASILDKLDATGRTDAVAQGVRLGLLML